MIKYTIYTSTKLKQINHLFPLITFSLEENRKNMYRVLVYIYRL